MGQERGLTLIEVVVAMLLLSIALMGLAVGFPSSRGAVYMGDQLSTAVSLARQTLEQMRNSGYTTAVDNITNANFPDQDPIPGLPPGSIFRRTVQILPGVPEAVCVPPSVAPNTACSKTVIVTVFYRDNAAQEQQVALTTIFVR